MNENVQSSEAILEELERTKWSRVAKNLLKDWRLYVMLIPLMTFMFFFRYLPIYGLVQGFKESKGGATNVLDAKWVGFDNLKKLFDLSITSEYGRNFWRAFRNTFVNSMYGLFFGFPIPIFLALLFSEIKNGAYRSFLQIFTYLPHFLSVVVTSSIITLWCSPASTSGAAAGMLTTLFEKLHWVEKGQAILETPKFFRPIFQIAGIWEGSGYGSIVYFAAILAISPANYEAAKIDGATKLQQIRYVTLPGMAPTLSIMLILRIGQILNIGFERVMCLYTAQTYETADVISTFVQRNSGAGGAQGGDQAVGVIADLFNSIIAMCLVLGANAISRRVSSTSLF